jgi:hypothetical protein
LQLVGRPTSSLDVGMLQIPRRSSAGRVRDISGDAVTFADDLIASTAAADLKMAEVLARIDRALT